MPLCEFAAEVTNLSIGKDMSRYVLDHSLGRQQEASDDGRWFRRLTSPLESENAMNSVIC